MFHTHRKWAKSQFITKVVEAAVIIGRCVELEI
jgi:hypothetical protein